MFRNFPFFIIFSSNHTIIELWGFFYPTMKLVMTWEQVGAMRKESVMLRAQVVIITRFRARGVAGTTAVGPATTTIATYHHPPRVATMSRWVIRREYPSSHQSV
jgi:hypothetical protein